VHSYRCNKNGKGGYAQNELVIEVLSNETINTLIEGGATKLQGRKSCA